MFFYLCFFASLPASILTKWPAHLILRLINLHVWLHCIPTSFLRSFVLRLSTLFFLVIRRTQLFSRTCSLLLLLLLLLFCQHHCLQTLQACWCNTCSQDFPFQLFRNVSVQHDSVYLSPGIRSRLYPTSHSASECLLRNHSSKVHKAIHLLDLLTIQPDVQLLSLVSNSHHFCLLLAHSQSVLFEPPLPFLQHFL